MGFNVELFKITYWNQDFQAHESIKSYKNTIDFVIQLQQNLGVFNFSENVDVDVYLQSKENFLNYQNLHPNTLNNSRIFVNSVISRHNLEEHIINLDNEINLLA